MYTPYNEKRHQKHPFYDKAKVQLFFRPQFSGLARVFVYSVFRGVLNRVYGILQLKYGYSVYHFL